jgi:hypothetical protein
LISRDADQPRLPVIVDGDVAHAAGPYVRRSARL